MKAEMKKPTATILDLRPRLPKRNPLAFIKPIITPPASERSERAEILDLRGKRKLYCVVGLGDVGKSTWLTWMLERPGVDFENVALASVLAPYDTGNSEVEAYHALANRFGNRVMVPEGDPTMWLSLLLSQVLQPATVDEAAPHVVIDFGAGGEAALLGLCGRLGTQAVLDEFAKAALVPVLVAPFSPREECLAPLAALRQIGFCPPATLLLPNHGRVTGSLPPSLAFAAIREHPIYEEALGRGAVEVWIPPCHGMHAVEGLHITLASQTAPLIADRLGIAHWRDTMEKRFRPVSEKGWLL